MLSTLSCTNCTLHYSQAFQPSYCEDAICCCTNQELKRYQKEINLSMQYNLFLTVSFTVKLREKKLITFVESWILCTSLFFWISNLISVEYGADVTVFFVQFGIQGNEVIKCGFPSMFSPFSFQNVYARTHAKMHHLLVRLLFLNKVICRG